MNSNAFFKRYFRWFATAAIATAALIQFASVRLESQTSDEGVHISAGYSYIAKGDYRMNPEHPPLGKILGVLPLLWLRPVVPTWIPAWETGEQWSFSYIFMYGNRVPAEKLLLYARSVTILLTAALGLAVAWWTRRRFGVVAAFLALTFTVFDPSIIAHGRYVTTDLIITLFFFLTVVLWTDYLEFGGRRRLAGAACAFAMAMGSKYSAMILIPIMGLMYLAHAWKTRHLDLRRLAVSGAVLLFGTVVVIGLLYARETARIVGGAAATPSYVKGFSVLLQHQKDGHPAYLLGEISSQGWWYYFPVAFAVKTPSGVLLLAAVVLALGIRRLWRMRPDLPEIPFVVIALGIPIFVYFGWSLTSSIDIGIRHLLPIYPLLYVMLAAISVRIPSGVLLASAALVLVLAESLACYPNYLGFFNSLSGGRNNGETYLLDSNIDWGQDAKKLADYVKREGQPPLCISYFGSADLTNYGLQWKPLASSDAESGSMDCLAAVSVNHLYGLWVSAGTLEWLRAYRPIAKIGSSIYIYDFRRSSRAAP